MTKKGVAMHPMQADVESHQEELVVYEHALVLDCTSSNQHDNADCDLAVIEVSDQLVSAIERRSALFADLKSTQEGLFALLFSDHEPDFLALESSELERIWDSPQFQACSWAFVERLVIPESVRQVIDRNWMEIAQHGVCWTAIPTSPADDAVRITTIDVSLPALVKCRDSASR